MKRHLEVHTEEKHNHVQIGEKPNQCKHCDKLFFDNSDLSGHIKMHTGEKAPGAAYRRETRPCSALG